MFHLQKHSLYGINKITTRLYLNVVLKSGGVFYFSNDNHNILIYGNNINTNEAEIEVRVSTLLFLKFN
jgi:hypothetical protein